MSLVHATWDRSGGAGMDMMVDRVTCFWTVFECSGTIDRFGCGACSRT